MSAPFIDLHVLRDDSTELTLYGDDHAAIAEPTPAQYLAALDRLDAAITLFRRVAVELRKDEAVAIAAKLRADE